MGFAYRSRGPLPLALNCDNTGCFSDTVSRALGDVSEEFYDTLLLGKIEGGLDHWLPFVSEPAVSPTNNAAENALREPVILRKLIGTLRNERGMFVHETALTLLATWSQQGHNPYEELQRVVRNDEIISPDQAVPEVVSG